LTYGSAKPSRAGQRRVVDRRDLTDPGHYPASAGIVVVAAVDSGDA
jgi:hypothetical protein